jgi:cytochrome c2
MNRKKSLGLILLTALIASSCGNENGFSNNPAVNQRTEPTPDVQKPIEPNKADGKEVFRKETFGNEGFWNDAARLPQGLIKTKLTPLQALKLGLNINAEALDYDLQKSITRELYKEGYEGKILNDPETTVKLLNSNAIIGLVVKDSNRDGKIDISNGDKLGVSCVLCHGVTDANILDYKGGGSIGRQIDGPSVHRLNLGAILAKADNTKAFFPMAQLKDEDGKSIGRAPSENGLTKDSTEEEFDSYFSNTAYYPVGTFDDTLDGFGNPMLNGSAFRADLSAPYGSAGEFEKFDQYANHKYSGLMDPTNILTKEGRQFMERISGSLGVKISADYAEVLAQTGVKEYPFVRNSGKSIVTSNTLFGVKVNESKLKDLKVYLSSLHSPRGIAVEKINLAKGGEIFKSSKTGCVACHNVDQSSAVNKDIVDMNVIFKGDNPLPIRKRDSLIHPLQDTTGSTFDDKMIVINASMRGLNRGVAMPLLLGLSKKPAFLHDGSVPTLTKLLDPARGDSAPHAYYLSSTTDRADVVAYLKSLEDTLK